MKGYTVTLNGQPIGRSDKLNIPEEYKGLQVTRKDKAEGTLTFDFQPGPLYESKARTGRPKHVEVLPWQ